MIPLAPAGAKLPGVAFLSSAYVRSHGKQPRGRGCWIFCPMTHYNKPDYLEHCGTVSGAATTLTEAKRAAAAYFGEEYDYVVICP